MWFVLHDDVVENLSPATAHPAFRDAILPRGLNARPFRLKSRCFEKGNHVCIECRIAIEDGVAVRKRFRESLPQLLDDPLRSRVAGHVEVQNPAPSMLDHEETVQQPERHRRHREEIERGNRLPVILQKGEPPLSWIATAAERPKIPGYAPFREHETELLKFSVDPRGAPIRVLLCQASDQNTNLIANLRSAAAWPGSPTPIELEAGAVPTDHGLGLDDEQDVGPSGPAMAEGAPEEPVQGVQNWPRPFPFQHGHLLPEGEDLEGGIAPTAEEDSHDGDE